jgi:MATE family multidrug resistance protein
MFTNVTCMSLLIGMSSGVETLASQFNGAKQYKEVGNVLWRCLAILYSMLLPIGVIWVFSGAIFYSIGIDEGVCQVITNYLRIRALLLPIDALNVSFEKYLMAIGVVAPTFYASVIFNVCLLACNLLFILHLELDYTFLAWSWFIADIVSTAFMLAFSWRHPAVQRTLQPFSTSAAFTGWWQFIALGLPAAAMLCSEWWAYEILSIFAAALGTEAIAAQVIIFQTAAFLFMIPLGLGIATASLVGNAIGAKKRALAVQLAKLSLATICVMEGILAILVTLKGDLFINFFTPDENVRAIAKQSLFFMGFFCFFDSIQGTCSGILRGAGKQAIGAITNVVGFYVIGLPLSFVICFKFHYGVTGLLMGMGGAVIFQNCVYLVFIFCYEQYIFPDEAIAPASSAIELPLAADSLVVPAADIEMQVVKVIDVAAVEDKVPS